MEIYPSAFPTRFVSSSDALATGRLGGVLRIPLIWFSEENGRIVKATAAANPVDHSPENR